MKGGWSSTHHLLRKDSRPTSWRVQGLLCVCATTPVSCRRAKPLQDCPLDSVHICTEQVQKAGSLSTAAPSKSGLHRGHLVCFDISVVKRT